MLILGTRVSRELVALKRVPAVRGETAVSLVIVPEQEGRSWNLLWVVTISCCPSF